MKKIASLFKYWLLPYFGVLILIISCGSRKSELQKSTENNEIQTKQKAAVKTSENTEVKNDLSKIDNSQKIENKSSENTEKAETNTENTSEKKTEESNSKTYLNREFYENGNLKSETHSSENFSKISAEKDYWKSSAISYKESYENSLTENRNLRIDNIFYKKTYEEISNKNAESQVKISTLQQELNRQTERKAYPFWIWILVGMAICFLIKFLWKKLISSNFILKILNKLK